jgi:hypothetical protein
VRSLSPAPLRRRGAKKVEIYTFLFKALSFGEDLGEALLWFFSHIDGF